MKVLAKGELTKPLTVHAHAFSAAAREAIEAAGGTCVSRRAPSLAPELARMLATILSAFTVAEIRKKLAFTALLLALYRLGSHIPVPGINIEAVNDDPGAVRRRRHPQPAEHCSRAAGCRRIALFALGIMPYITASIILQLLTVVVPSLEKLQKEGEVGQARITQYTRYLTVGLAFAQSIGYVFLFRSLRSQRRARRSSTNFDVAARLPDRHLADRGQRCC